MDHFSQNAEREKKKTSNLLVLELYVVICISQRSNEMFSYAKKEKYEARSTEEA